MNIYDKKQIKCSICGKFIGEIDVDAKVVFPLCKTCKKREIITDKKGISKILVPVDDTKKSFKALDAAIYFGKHLGASITLFHVIPAAYMTAMSFRKMLKELTDEGVKNIKKAKAYCQKKNMTPKYKIARGDEPEEIVKFAKKQNIDLIVMGSSGKGVLKEIAFGSVSNYVMNNTKIPVVIIKEESKKLDTSISKYRKLSNKKLKKSTTKIPKHKSKNIRHGDGVSFKKMKQSAGI